MNNTDDHDIVQVAYHEAGHAVAAYVLRVPFTQVSIVSDSESFGRLSHDQKHINSLIEAMDYSSYDKRAERRIDNNLIVYFSGAAAEEIYSRQPVALSGSDREIVILFLFKMGYRDLAEPIKEYHDKAIELLRNNWNVVSTLVPALIEHKRLSRKKAGEIIRSGILHPKK